MTEDLSKPLKLLKWDRILLAVIALGLGVLFVAAPDTSADILCTILGILLIVAGVAGLVGFFTKWFFTGGYTLVIGMVALLCGIFCLVNPDVVKTILTVIFGLLIIVDGCNNAADAFACARIKTSGWGAMMILSLLTVALGCVVMFGRFDAIMIFAGCVLLFDGLCSLAITLVFSRRIREAREVFRREKEDPELR